MRVRRKTIAFALVALLAMIATSVVAMPRADAQICAAVTTGGQLAACIEGYNVTPSGVDRTITIASDITLAEQLPDINNSSPSPPKLSILGNGLTLDVGGQPAGLVIIAGDVSVFDVTIQSAGVGLGIAGGKALVVSSTFVDNTDGMVVFEPGVLEVYNSTIAGNQGGVWVVGTGSDTGAIIADLHFTTIVGNDAKGGVFGESSGLARITSSLVAANGVVGDCRGEFFIDRSLGGNVFGDTTCAGTATPGLLGTFDTKLDFNGCTLPCTRTVALFAGSPAVFAGNCGAGQFDQRGFQRPEGLCDAGAFEFLLFCRDRLITIDMNTNGGNGTGTAGDDVILGTDQNDLIDAGAGDDVICAIGGDDTVTGGPGNDVISGGVGNDRLFGSQGDDEILGLDGDDTIFGEDGRDIARGGPGSDAIDGGPGNDRLLGGIGDDELDGGDGDDYLGGFGGADTIDGGLGMDKIFGGFGGDIIDGGAGDDVIRGLIGNDTINGGAGDDRLDGDRGNDIIDGGPGNDVIGGGNANDVLRGGPGNDQVSGGRADDQLSGGDDTDTCIGNLHITGDTADATCEQRFGIP